MVRDLSEEEFSRLKQKIAAFDLEPIAEDTALKAVHCIASNLGIAIRESRAGSKDLVLTRGFESTTVRPMPEDQRYHCWSFNVIQGAGPEWEAKTTSELAWQICGRPRIVGAHHR
jgi:hypothetical protein